MTFASFQSIFSAQQARSQDLRKEPIRTRKERLNRMHRYLLSHREEVIEALQLDFQKPREDVEASELYPVLSELRHTIRHLNEWSRPKLVDTPLGLIGSRSEVRLEPRGVCLIIAPWNFPFNLCFGPLVSCIAAGNTAVLKPSELTPHTSALVRKFVAEMFSPDEVTVVEGDAETSTALLKLPFDHIFFTGSPAVGKIVMQAAAANLTPVTLELGGKSPVIVDSSAPLKEAARRIAFGKFFNNGQTCIAPDYVLVHADVQEEFLRQLKDATTSMFAASGNIRTSPSYGRIVNQRHFDRIKHLIDDARSRGAREVLAGECDRDARFIPPHILSDIPTQAVLLAEEIFGPVLPVIPYQNNQEALDFINQRPRPLALYLFGRNARALNELERQIPAGTVCLNECVVQFTHVNLPFGGINNSGIGKSHGYYGFQTFSNEKPVLRQKHGFATPQLLYPPYNRFKKLVIDLMVKWL